MSPVGTALATTGSTGGDAGGSIADPLPLVRQAVRDLLSSSSGFRELDPETQREMAEAMVKVCHRGALLLKEEIESEEDASANAESDSELSPATEPPSSASGAVSLGRTLGSSDRRPLARAQSGPGFGAAARTVAGTTREILNAVSFPRFVAELINGVFKAMVDTNQQQMQSFVELIKNVSASTEGFADANVGPARARAWLAERYPASFVVEGEQEPEEEGWESPFPEEESASASFLRLRPGASMPPPEAMKIDLGLGPDESAPTSGDPERTLVPLARRALARQRQALLASMITLGMQRIVIESGRIHASMRFHIDTRSAMKSDRGSRFDFQNVTKAAGSYGFGPWGVSASMTNTVGYVSTQKTQTTEEVNTDLDLSSSVELYFKSDYLPLEHMAGKEVRDRIKVKTLNPEAEAERAAKARGERETRREASEKARRGALDSAIGSRRPPPADTSDAGTVAAARRAREDAARRAGGGDASGTGTGTERATAPTDTGAGTRTGTETGARTDTGTETRTTT